MGQLLFTNDDGRGSLCSGSMINANTVLTAAVGAGRCRVLHRPQSSCGQHTARAEMSSGGAVGRLWPPAGGHWGCASEPVAARQQPPRVSRTFCARIGNCILEGLPWGCLAAHTPSPHPADLPPPLASLAQHCVHGGAGGGWSTNLRFAAGRDDWRQPFGSVSYAWITTYSSFTNQAWPDSIPWDMAVVRLSESVGQRTGWLGMAASDYYSATINTAGYPGDKGGSTMWYNNCPASDSSPWDGVTRVQCDIIGGQSGSPAWTLEGSNRFIRGIVSYSSGDHNGLVQLTTTRFNDARSWMNS